MVAAEWLWTAPSQIVTPDDWRMTGIDVDGVDYRRDGRHRSIVLFGPESQFCALEKAIAVLDLIEELLGLDPDVWRWQQPFFLPFIRSFFRQKASPGWIRIAQQRRPFQARMQDVMASAVHRGQSCERLFASRSLRQEHLAIDDSLLSAARLRMAYRPGVPSRDLQLYRMSIRRNLADDGLGTPLHCNEDWQFLGSRSGEERAARRQGANLTLKDYPSPRSGGLMAPLISMCRFNEDRRWVLNRVFSVVPRVGEVIDFRTVTHRCDFYFRSDLSNHTLIRQAITPGLFERF